MVAMAAVSVALTTPPVERVSAPDVSISTANEVRWSHAQRTVPLRPREALYGAPLYPSCMDTLTTRVPFHTAPSV